MKFVFNNYEEARPDHRGLSGYDIIISFMSNPDEFNDWRNVNSESSNLLSGSKRQLKRNVRGRNSALQVQQIPKVQDPSCRSNQFGGHQDASLEVYRNLDVQYADWGMDEGYKTNFGVESNLPMYLILYDFGL